MLLAAACHSVCTVRFRSDDCTDSCKVPSVETKQKEKTAGNSYVQVVLIKLLRDFDRVVDGRVVA
jgi:hypothetical protein